MARLTHAGLGRFGEERGARALRTGYLAVILGARFAELRVKTEGHRVAGATLFYWAKSVPRRIISRSQAKAVMLARARIASQTEYERTYR